MDEKVKETLTQSARVFFAPLIDQLGPLSGPMLNALAPILAEYQAQLLSGATDQVRGFYLAQAHTKLRELGLVERV